VLAINKRRASTKGKKICACGTATRTRGGGALTRGTASGRGTSASETNRERGRFFHSPFFQSNIPVIFLLISINLNIPFSNLIYRIYLYLCSGIF